MIDTAPQHAGLTSSVLPEANSRLTANSSQTGVSIRSVHSLHKVKKWYVLRATYGKEKEAADYLASQGVECYRPEIKSVQSAGKVQKIVVRSRIPNIFFANSTMDVLKEYVFDNFHMSTRRLRFYYNCHHDGTKEPLIVPENQIRSLRIICESEAADVMFSPSPIEKFKRGQHVKVHEGEFAGVEGIVARFSGQQRVGIIIKGVITAITAYIPSAFLEKI